eukprot:14091985-Alexandrium_andersonii.AAC.1
MEEWWGPVTGLRHMCVRGEAPPGWRDELTALADAASEFPYRIGVFGGKTTAWPIVLDGNEEHFRNASLAIA